MRTEFNNNFIINKEIIYFLFFVRIILWNSSLLLFARIQTLSFTNYYLQA